MSDGTRILFPDFREEQKDSRYPFVDTATLVSTDGTVQVERDTFIDAVFHIIDATSRIHISSIAVTTQNVIINFSDAFNINVASTSFAPSPVQDTQTGALQIFDPFGRPAGMIVATAEKLALFAGWAVGVYEFDVAETEFVATTVIPANEPGVRGVKTTSTQNLMTGDIWLIGDGGVTFRHEGVKDGKQIIRVDITGLPLFQRYQCIPFDRFQSKNFVRTINNCPPDEYGNFTLTATGQQVEDTVLRVSQGEGIIFIDAIGRKVV
jgi:hypothetical protein